MIEKLIDFQNDIYSIQSMLVEYYGSENKALMNLGFSVSPDIDEDEYKISKINNFFLFFFFQKLFDLKAAVFSFPQLFSILDQNGKQKFNCKFLFEFNVYTLHFLNFV